MGAIVKACQVGTSIRNTGKECDIAMGPTALIIMTPPGFSFKLSDLTNPNSWLTKCIHASQQLRIYPLFGLKTPISTITNNKENDVLVTLDDGTQVLLRYGMYNRMYETIAGGLCYAEVLQSLNRSGYGMIEIDGTGQMLVHDNMDGTPTTEGTYTGLTTTFMYGTSPTLADLKTTPYKNGFQVSYSPTEMVNNGAILKGAQGLLSYMGLIETKIVNAGAISKSGFTASTSTNTVVRGATNDTIDIFSPDGADLSGVVIQTGAETSDTLLAAKVVTAINGFTATTGWSATNAAGVITLTAPADYGANPNTKLASAVIVGAITFTPAAFANGVTGTVMMPISVKTECAGSDLISLFGIALAKAANFVITNTKTGIVTVATTANIVNGQIQVTGPFTSGTYLVTGAPPATWLSNGINGYDAETDGATFIVP